ncbi:E3 ubiquitin-protein ligase TRIM13 [Discoglossus pictus]
MNVMEVLEEDLTCPICCSLFDDPRVLPCSHNFCKKCLEGIVEGNSRNMLWRPSSFKCPTCRKETPTMGVNGHQVNYLLKGIVEKYNKIKIAPKMPMCKMHSGQPLNIYCSTDLKLICGICATSGEHTDHVFSSIEEAYNKEKNSFKTLFQGFEDWHCGDVISHLDALEANKRKSLHMLTKDSDRVKAYFEKLQHVLEQKKNEILSDFETMKLAVMQAYDPEINKLNTVLNEQKKACNIAEDFKDISDPLTFLQQMQEFREKVRIIKDATLPSNSDMIVSPCVKNFDTSMWDNIKLVDVDKLSLPQETPTWKFKIQMKFPQSFMAIAFLLISMVAFWAGPFIFDHLQNLDIQQYSVSSYLPDTMVVADQAAIYWEQVAEVANIVREKCQNYIMLFLEKVAELVCKYKL